MAKKRKIEKYSGFSIRPLKDGGFMADNCRYDQPGTPSEARRRRVKRCATLADARAWIDQTAAEMEKHGLSAFSLGDDGRRDASGAMRILASRASLAEAAEFWKKHHPDGETVPVSEMVQRFMDWHVGKGSKPETIREIRRRLAGLVEVFGKDMPIARFSREALREFFAGRDGGAASKNAWVKVLRAFFGFCEREEVVQDNPARKLEKVKLPSKSPEFWTVEQVTAVLKAAEAVAPDYAAGMAILFFAGLRPTELAGQYGLEDARVTEAKKALAKVRAEYEAEKVRLGLDRGRGADTEKQAKNREKLEASKQAADLAAALAKLAAVRERHGGTAMPGLQWADVNLFEGFIRVRGETSKMAQSRLVSISPNLAAWLAKYGGKKGGVVDNPTGFHRARERVLAHIGQDEWGHDVARHTYATMHFAEHQNRDLLAAQMGHRRGSGMLETHYKGLATASEARRFWAIAPKGVKLAAKVEEKAERKAEA